MAQGHAIDSGLTDTQLRATPVPVSGTITAITNVVHVDDNAGSLTVDNGGTFAVQVDGSALTALQKIDDPVLVDDAAFTPASSSVMMAGAQFDDSSPDSVDEGDAGAIRMSSNRNLYVRIRDNAGNERGLNIDTNGALAATVTNGTAANCKVEATIASAQTLATVTTVGTVTTITNVVHVDDNSSSLTVDNGGTFAVQVDGAALTSLQLIDDAVYAEDVASQPADKGIAVLGVRQDTDATMVGTSGDYANLQVNHFGYLKVTTPAASSLAHGQVSVDTTSGGVTIVASRTFRKRLIIVNHGTTDVYIGTATGGPGATAVTTSNGLLLLGVRGATLTLYTNETVKGIVAAGTQTVSYIEEYDP